MAPTNDQVRNAIAQQAADWFVMHRAGPLSSRDARAFAGWLRLSPMHVEEYLATAAAVRDLRKADRGSFALEQLVAEARSDIADSVPSITSGMQRRVVGAGRSWRVGLAPWLPQAVAAAALLLAVAALWAGRLNWLGWPASYETRAALPTTTVLPDGSTLVLDARSAATVRFGPSERFVEVLRGRAHFSVAHGSRRPFRVAAGAASIVAVGTEFDVDRRAQATIVTVTEGRVEVRGSAGPAAAPAGGARDVAVSAGERVRVSAEGVASRDASFNPRSEAGWREGTVMFDRELLSEVIEEFNRYAAVPFEIADPAIGDVRISGVFDRRDPESLTLFLQSLDGVVVERTAEHVRLVRAGPPGRDGSPPPR